VVAGARQSAAGCAICLGKGLKPLARDQEADDEQPTDALRSLRLHGDCHPGNILWTPLEAPASSLPGPHFVDLDDARMGPAVQDLWMLLSGDRQQRTRQLGALGRPDFCHQLSVVWLQRLLDRSGADAARADRGHAGSAAGGVSHQRVHRFYSIVKRWVLGATTFLGSVSVSTPLSYLALACAWSMSWPS